MSDRVDYLAARGLADYQQDQTTEVVTATLPPDYPARVRALELSCDIALHATHAIDRHLILVRAADFHSFLIARNPPDDEVVQTDD